MHALETAGRRALGVLAWWAAGRRGVGRQASVDGASWRERQEMDQKEKASLPPDEIRKVLAVISALPTK